MKERFQDFKFKPATVAMITRANTIIEDLQSQGYTLTLRQLYYQLVARDIIANKQTEYKRLGSILNDARLAGLVDWDAIEDRTRNLRGLSHWNTPSEVISSAAYSYRIDKWADQKNYVEVWVEKDALVGVLEKACDELDIKYFSCRGYTSQSELYSAGKRIGRIARRLKRNPVVIHLGDHDPSGIDMTRDITDRVSMFAERHVEIKRIALNRDQIDQYDPPPNPAKITDSRFEAYAAIHGEESWELDALDPKVIDDLIRETVYEFRDDDKWNEAVEREQKEREVLTKISDNYDDVERYVEENL
jgi:hypothetical protein